MEAILGENETEPTFTESKQTAAAPSAISKVKHEQSNPSTMPITITTTGYRRARFLAVYFIKDSYPLSLIALHQLNAPFSCFFLQAASCISSEEH